MSSQTFLKRYVKRITVAQQSVDIPGAGSFIFVESASQAFQIQIDQKQRSDVKGRFKLNYAPDEFRRLTIYNTGTATLTVIIWIGAGGISYDEIVIPQTVITGQTVALADDGEMSCVGVNASGQRRKQITITLRPSLAGRVEVYSIDSAGVKDDLLAIVAASSSGGGFAIETDVDLIIRNKTGGAISSTVDPRDIAVAETFYV
jgi:hypothetical protein